MTCDLDCAIDVVYIRMKNRRLDRCQLRSGIVLMPVMSLLLENYLSIHQKRGIRICWQRL